MTAFVELVNIPELELCVTAGAEEEPLPGDGAVAETPVWNGPDVLACEVGATVVTAVPLKAMLVLYCSPEE